MKYACPPDLPFLQLLMWHLKNFGAALVIIAAIGLIYGLFIAAHEWRKSRKKKG